MKKILTFALLLVTVIVSGCGSKYSDETYIKENATWVADKDNIADFLDVTENFDEDFFTQQFLEGRIIGVDKQTKIAVTGELNGGKIVEIKFMEGRFKNRVGYTIPRFVRDLVKEDELAKKQAEERRAVEAKKLEEQEKQNAERAKKERSLMEKLAADGQLPVIQDGVQIICTMTDGTDAYQKLLGKTNLPEGTRLSITLAGVKKETAVQQDATFFALFERLIIPTGEQDISIMSLDKAVQPVDVQTADDLITKEKGSGFLGKEIYAGKIKIQ